MTAPINKSTVLGHIRCVKRGYLLVREPKRAAPLAPGQELRLREGRMVGEAARLQFPDGVLVAGVGLGPNVLARTRECMKAGNAVIFEAAFAVGNTGVRVDILQRLPRGKWHLIEVKATKEPKPEHDLDLAVQWLVVNAARINVARAFVCVLDPSARVGDACPFRIVDRTKAVKACLAQARGAIRRLRAHLRKNEAPKVGIGPWCLSPEDCAFKTYCWKAAEVPDMSVLDLPGMRSEKKWALFHSGARALTEVPTKGLTALQKRVVESVRGGALLLDRGPLRAAMSEWVYPHYHLDFEAIAPPLPRFDDVGPYGVVPVQFSVVIDTGNDVQETDFLHKDGTDPRPELAKALVAAIPPSGGTVVAYNAAYEKQVLTALAHRFPALRVELLSIATRLRDPLALVRSHVYHPDFGGSFSIKVVGKALLGPVADYKQVRVRNGLEAVVAFEEMTAPGCSPSRQGELREQLREYCRHDTLVMQKLVRWLRDPP